MAKKFGSEMVRSYQMSSQSKGQIPRAFLRAFDEMTFPAAVLALLVASFYAVRRGLNEAASLSLFVSAALVINNVICALDRRK